MTWDLIKGPSEAQHEAGMLNLDPKVLHADPSSRPEFDVTRIRANLVVWPRGEMPVDALVPLWRNRHAENCLREPGV